MNMVSDCLVLFGISGDLAHKKLFPALYDLTADNHLDFPVVGVAASPWDDEQLRDHARASLKDAGKNIDEDVFSRLAANLCYVEGDYRNKATYQAIVKRLQGRTRPVFYLAIPPSLFDDVVEGLSSVELHKSGRLVVEKPFGRDGASATELDKIIHRSFPEEQVFRIDHFLGKDAVQNLMVFRFSNTILEPIWNRQYIREIQITLAEDFGVEGRGSFYDDVGAIRDVIQNHVFQMVTLLAMEPPLSDGPDALRDERSRVLRAINALTPGDVVRGQYDGYLKEDGVKPDSDTETYAAVRLEIDSWRWAGIPWIIRAGKGLARTVTEAVVQFDRPPVSLFAADAQALGANRLTFRTEKDAEITLSMRARLTGSEMVSEPVDFTVEGDQNAGAEAYGRLLQDALEGDSAMFGRQDGVQEAWRIVDPILTDHSPVHPYPFGSWGPSTADQILPNGTEWLTR